MPTSITAFAACSQSLILWGIKNTSGSLYWSSSLCGQNNSHSLNNYEYIWTRASTKYTTGNIAGTVKVSKTLNSGSCYVTASLRIPHNNNREGQWQITASVGTSSLNCNDTTIVVNWAEPE